MARNFVIALASAFGSATLILLLVRLVLKAIAPDTFKELIPVPKPNAGREASETTEVRLPGRRFTIDSAMILRPLVAHGILPARVAVHPVQSEAPSLGGLGGAAQQWQNESPQLRKMKDHVEAISR